MDRRTFMGRMASTVAVASASGCKRMDSRSADGECCDSGNPVEFGHYVPADKKLDPAWRAALLERDARRPYEGRELETLGMPCGGICAGQLYVRGDGSLAHWWIANNAYNTGYGIYDHVTTPMGTYPQGYGTYRPISPVDQGVAVRVKTGDGKVHVGELNATGFDEIEFYGEYPVATIQYGTRRGPSLPVTVSAEVFSPFIPLNARDSAIPTTILNYSVTNTTTESLDVALAGWLQSAVLLPMKDRVAAANRNRVVSDTGSVSVVMDAVASPDVGRPAPRVTVFDDFEDGTFDEWRVEGDAFGTKPSTKADKVSGWQGTYFASSHHGGAAATGRMVSKKFKIKEKYAVFSICGKSYPGETGLRLVIDGRTVRDSVSSSRDRFSERYWDVTEFSGQTAHIEILDYRTDERWGRIAVDSIHFTDRPPLDEVPFSTDHPYSGNMTFTVLDDDATASVDLRSKDVLLDALAKDGLSKAADKIVYPSGDIRLGSLTSRFRLGPGRTKRVAFLVSWHFPNRAQDNTSSGWGNPVGGTRPVGNMYRNWFSDSLDVARYVAANFDRLRDDTLLFRDTYFDTTLPYWFVQRVAMPLANLATETCQWWADGRFWAWEGVGCCFGTCTHVWNYAQGLARVFPELERSVREMNDFGEAQNPDTGAVGNRGVRSMGDRVLARTPAALDGHSGAILKAYREHLMSPDNAFVERNWPRIKRAVEWLMDQDEGVDGLLEGRQPNTYDISFQGGNTYVGALYLAALRAAARMAGIMGEPDFARRLDAVAETGSRLSVERLWNGEYFEQDVDLEEHPLHQYAEGCLSDQLFGQAWAHQLGLGALYPTSKVQSALASVWKYNWAPDVKPQNIAHPPERVYASPGEAGLFICTWPRSPHLDEKGVRYRNEVWTGIEYQVASAMLYEGMVEEAFAIVRAIHDRYDGVKHNPWNEIECGDHYSRALASWGCLLGAAGYVYDGPVGLIEFAPRVTPEDFKVFFTAAEGWGSLVQNRNGGTQTNRIEVKWGSVQVNEMIVEVPVDGSRVRLSSATCAGRKKKASLSQSGQTVSIAFAEPVVVHRNETLEVKLV